MKGPSTIVRRFCACLVISLLALLAFVPPATASAAPALIKDINPYGDSNPAGLTEVGSTLFFAANDGVHGTELWKSDGTAAGTKMVKNIRPYGKGSYPAYLTNLGGTLYFFANDGSHGQELWKSDGTKAGTVMVKDIHTGPNGQFGGNGTNLHAPPIILGNHMFFFVDSCCVGTSMLHVSDGTAAGTYYIDQEDDFDLELPDEASVGTASGKLYFVAGHWDGERFGYRLWVSDGTATGTHLVAGSPTAENMSILPRNGTKLYFYAGSRLWRTDGTKAGTLPLTSRGELGFVPDQAALMGKRLYFGESGMLGAFWKTDGTANGTKKITGDPVAFLIASGGRLYFSSHLAVIASDGTASGTHDLMRQSDGSWPRHLVPVGDKVCFFVPDSDANTSDLWESDGTPTGTHQVKSYVNPTGDDGPGVAIGNRFMFAADDGIHGVELWSYAP